MTTLIVGKGVSLLNRLVKQEKTYCGAIAQLVEHLHGMQGVSGSNPLGSIQRET